MTDAPDRRARDRLRWWAGAVVLGWAVLPAGWTMQPVALAAAGQHAAADPERRYRRSDA